MNLCYCNREAGLRLRDHNQLALCSQVSDLKNLLYTACICIHTCQFKSAICLSDLLKMSHNTNLGIDMETFTLQLHYDIQQFKDRWEINTLVPTYILSKARSSPGRALSLLLCVCLQWLLLCRMPCLRSLPWGCTSVDWDVCLTAVFELLWGSCSSVK